MKIWCWAFVLSLAAAGAGASSIRFSPAPPVAGQPIVVTFESVDFGCSDEGLLKVQSIAGNVVRLEVLPPGCPVLPPGFAEYTASITIGPLAAGTYTVLVTLGGGVLLDVESMEVKAPPVCNATDTSLCLSDGRFEVTGEWTDFDRRHGVAHTMPDEFDGLGDWGVLWFFSAENPEMFVKVLDACAVNGRYWVFLSPGSTVKYDIKVRDVRTGQQKVYSNPLGATPRLTPDTQTFPCS